MPQALAPAYNKPKRIESHLEEPEADAEKILRGFARRAYRRAVTMPDIKPLLALVKGRLADKYTFEQAVRVGLMGVLVSPHFLFLPEKTATRASAGEPAVVLCSLRGDTMPDGNC